MEEVMSTLATCLGLQVDYDFKNWLLNFSTFLWLHLCVFYVLGISSWLWSSCYFRIHLISLLVWKHDIRYKINMMSYPLWEEGRVEFLQGHHHEFLAKVASLLVGLLFSWFSSSTKEQMPCHPFSWLCQIQYWEYMIFISVLSAM